ncbi:MAG: hypothetical protein GKC03_07015 [Methanomassiliicoccales archaeon]|nr:hypothetical protein [Methanomassiliicoccales archaeon]
MSSKRTLAAHTFGPVSCFVGFGSLVKGNPKVVEALELTDEEQIIGQ